MTNNACCASRCNVYNCYVYITFSITGSAVHDTYHYTFEHLKPEKYTEKHHFYSITFQLGCNKAFWEIVAYHHVKYDETPTNCQNFYNNRGLQIYESYGIHRKMLFTGAFINLCSNFRGANCQVECPILKGGHCDTYTGSVICPTGLAGSNCDQEIVSCANNPCLNGGVCKDIDQSYLCKCPSEYSGDTCQIPTCNRLTCQNGVCLTKYTCACMSEYIGDRCEIGVCQHNFCLNQGTCSVPAGLNYAVCHCDNNSAGKRCEYLCEAGCGNNGKCTIDNNKAVCKCFNGYTGVSCSELSGQGICSTNVCFNGATCSSNATNVYTCNCKNGFSGSNCEISDCSHKPCNKGICMVAGGCLCLPGFSGSDCSTITSATYTKCLNNAQIDVSAGKHRCICNKNEETGQFCQHKCKVPCINGECVLKNGYVQCECNNGFEGESCEKPISNNPCNPNPCINNGVCRQNGNDYSCRCNPAFTGKSCERSICSLNNCYNGVCVTGVGCTCIDNFSGSMCEAISCPVSNQAYCMNGGKCSTSGITLKCECDIRRFTGNKCERKCPVMCSEFGTCQVFEGQTRCVCNSGFYGDSCSATSEFASFVKQNSIFKGFTAVGGVLICVLIFGLIMNRKKIQKQAMKNAMFDPSETLNLPSTEKTADVTDLYNVL